MSQQPDMRPDSVKEALTVNRPGTDTRTQRPTPVRKRRRSEVENDDFAQFAVRIIRAHGRRIAAGDVEGLAELLALRTELDAATQAAVDGLRERHGFSWAEIASRLGTSRQAAQMRWGKSRLRRSCLSRKRRAGPVIHNRLMSEEGRKRILLAPEYGIEVPLWERSDYPQSTDGEVAGLSPQLIERLRAWNEQWLEAHNRPEKGISRWSAAQAHAWTQLGYRLAWQLQAELPDVEILIDGDSGNDVAIRDLFGG